LDVGKNQSEMQNRHGFSFGEMFSQQIVCLAGEMSQHLLATDH